MTWQAGAIFGLAQARCWCRSASRLAPCLSFLLAAQLLRDLVAAHFSAQLAPIEAGVRRDGVLLPLSLRLGAGVSFFLINLVIRV